MKPLISIVTACYNEEANVQALYEAVRDVMRGLPDYRYEHIFADNASSDGTRTILRQICATDHNVKAIFNTRNFGVVRSGIHALTQAHGDAVIGVACDFQDPPDLIPTFLHAWRQGGLIVLGVKHSREERGPRRWARDWYYRLFARLSEAPVIPHATGFGLFDRRVVSQIRNLADPFPYFRGLIAEMGYPVVQVPYHQPDRRKGTSSYGMLDYFDYAMVGVTAHSRVPLRLMTLMGLVLSATSLLVGLGYLIAKLVLWNSFSLGIAPVVVGFFLLTSVQLLFIGLIGEYLGVVFTQVRRLPHVFELERINFDDQ